MAKKYYGEVFQQKQHITTLSKELTVEQLLNEHAPKLPSTTGMYSGAIIRLILAGASIPDVYVVRGEKGFLVCPNWLTDLCVFATLSCKLPKTDITFWSLTDKLQEQILQSKVRVHIVDPELSSSALMDDLADILEDV